MLIRKYTLEDQAEILGLFRLNTPQYFSITEENDLIYYLENHAQDYYVAVLSEKIVGSGGINFSEEGSVGKISWDLFHPDYQNKGLGSQLLRYRIELLKASPSVKKIMVRTSQLAYGFYEKNGFLLQEKVKDYWAEGFDLYSMEYVGD